MFARFAVTRDQIDDVVAAFYERIRQHPVLGPIFNDTIAAHGETWPNHEAKIARFWANAILFEREYSGNPMAAHLAVPRIQPQHFSVWLGIFDQTLQDVLPPNLARAWSELAHRIGHGLRSGIEMYRRPESQPPTLR